MTSGTRTRGAAVIAVAALGLACAPPAAGQESYEISGDVVAVYNLAGTAHVVRGSGSAVVVRVRRGGGDAERLRVETGEIRGRQTLRVIYPDDRVVYEEMGRRSRTTLRVRDDGTFGDGRRGGGERVEIRGSGRGLEAWADLEIEVPDGVEFSLYVGRGDLSAEDVSADLRLDVGGGQVQASGIEGRLVVDTGSGSVQVRDVTGDLLIDTGSGSVDVAGVRAGQIDIDTGSGGVEGRDLIGDRLRVDTGSGGVELAAVRAPEVFVDTGSGSVDVELLADVEELVIDTGSGSVTVTVPEDLGAEVEIETGSGGIDLDFPVQVRRASRSHVVGRIGDGEGSIVIDTGSGRVRLIQG
ncbi:MAG: hypothetical protein D6701_01800 [Gemmatimonadetes bacterium]|nr:MAG: hypothetical protein D6701_01800 [Gemmatimonadota bacterium]